MIEQQPIQPVGRFDASVRVPGSKSLTNRALVLAALADGTSTIDGILLSDDTHVMLDALRELGFDVTVHERRRQATITGQRGAVPRDHAALHLGNSGTSMRSLAAACCLGAGRHTLDGVPRMRERPIGELVDALTQLGAAVDYLDRNGFPPLRVHAGTLRGGQVEMANTLSSQFITAILMVAPCTPEGVTIRFGGPVTSQAYVEMTLRIMEQFGVASEVASDFSQISVKPGTYSARTYAIEPDASNASYFIAAAAASPGRHCVLDGLGSSSLQGDVGFAKVLGEMGAEVTIESEQITVAGTGELRGVDIDLNAMPDMAQTLACLAVLAEGRTAIRNVGNLRVKETDRMEALRVELTKLGASVDVLGDDLLITPPPGGTLQPAAIDTYDDHRMAMAFSVIGLTRPGVTINEPSCVNKTFPAFFDYLAALERTGDTPARLTEQTVSDAVEGGR